MNRAAEAAVPEAKALLVDSVRKMSVQDAKGILTGGDTAATEYFRRTTQNPAHAALSSRSSRKPPTRSGSPSNTTSSPARPRSSASSREDQSTIEGYVTQKALDGLYLMIAEQEKAFRQNPLGATSDIVKRVFGAVR